MYINMYIGLCSLAPLLSPRLPVRVRLLPGRFQNLKFWGSLTGSENDRNLSFRAFKVGVARHVNLWGPSA